MSILIKGVEMPKFCDACPLARFYEFGMVYCNALDAKITTFWDEGNLEKPEDCPLVEVPTPHGRLIEAERLMHKLIRYGGISPWYEEELCYTIKDMDTIIEAEE